MGENHHAAMTALANTDGEWRRIGAGIWPHPGTKRSLQIFFFNPLTKSVEFRAFRDIAVRDDAPTTPPH